VDLSAPPYLFWLLDSKEKVRGGKGAQYIVRIYKEFNNNNEYTNVIENVQESILTFRPTSSSCPCHIKPQTNLTDIMLNENKYGRKHRQCSLTETMTKILGFRHVSLWVSKKIFRNTEARWKFRCFLFESSHLNPKFQGRLVTRMVRRRSNGGEVLHYQQHNDVKTTSSEKANTELQNKQRLFPSIKY